MTTHGKPKPEKKPRLRQREPKMSTPQNDQKSIDCDFELDKLLNDLPTVVPAERSQVARVEQPATAPVRPSGHPWLLAIWLVSYAKSGGIQPTFSPSTRRPWAPCAPRAVAVPVTTGQGGTPVREWHVTQS